MYKTWCEVDYNERIFFFTAWLLSNIFILQWIEKSNNTYRINDHCFSGIIAASFTFFFVTFFLEGTKILMFYWTVRIQQNPLTYGQTSGTNQDLSPLFASLMIPSDLEHVKKRRWVFACKLFISIWTIIIDVYFSIHAITRDMQALINILLLLQTKIPFLGNGDPCVQRHSSIHYHAGSDAIQLVDFYCCFIR